MDRIGFLARNSDSVSIRSQFRRVQGYAHCIPFERRDISEFAPIVLREEVPKLWNFVGG